MRVLHFFKSYAPDSFGGTQTVIGDMARATARFGIETEVLSLSRRPGENSLHIEGHWARKARLDFEFASTGFSISAFSMFRQMAREADLVHYHYPWPMMDAVHFWSGVDKPTVVTYHSDIVRQRVLRALYRPLMRRFLHSVTAIVATSPNYVASSSILQSFGDKLSVIPIGTHDIMRCAVPDEVAASWRARLGERYFAFVGALRYYKGLDFLLEAAARTHLPVAIIGGGELGPALAQQVAQRGLDNVHLLGELSETDKAAVLRGAYGFVFPSHLRSEAFGVALLEASAAGLPLICCELGTGTTYVNIDGETGIVVPPADAAALAEAMQRLWDDPGLASRMGGKARERYEALFTAEIMGEAYAGLYHQLVPAAR